MRWKQPNIRVTMWTVIGVGTDGSEALLGVHRFKLGALWRRWRLGRRTTAHGRATLRIREERYELHDGSLPGMRLIGRL